MSYVVTITREPPICADELRELVRSDATLDVLPDSSSGLVGMVWRGGAEAEMSMSFDNGAVWTTPGTEAELAKMQELAIKLGGHLIGEEGENLTNVKVARPAGAGCGGRVAVIFALMLLLAAVAVVA